MSKKIDPRILRTRYLLRESLITLIPTMGYDRLTVQDITQKAGLNRATFYLHYRDKQDLMTQIIDHVLDELAQVLLSSQAARDDLHQIFVRVFEHVAQNKVFYQVMLEEPSVADYVHRIQEHIQKIGMQALLTNSPPDRVTLTPPALFITFVGWAYIGVVKWWVSNQMPYSADYMAVQFVRMAIGGLQSEFGLGTMLTALEQDLKRRNADFSGNRDS
jgi:AcrR family transcriptional regulator